jgi:hypothetical protein
MGYLKVKFLYVIFINSPFNKVPTQSFFYNSWRSITKKFTHNSVRFKTGNSVVGLVVPIFVIYSHYLELFRSSKAR